MKTLGADYTEEAIAARSASRPCPSRQPKQRGKKINLPIDIQNNIKTQQSAGFKHWATIENLKQVAKAMNFITEHGIGNYGELAERCDAATARRRRLSGKRNSGLPISPFWQSTPSPTAGSSLPMTTTKCPPTRKSFSEASRARSFFSRRPPGP